MRSGFNSSPETLFIYLFPDEQLQSFLTLRIDNLFDEDTDPQHPPQDLLAFLAHLQVSLEASYISSVPVSASSETPRSAFLSAAPRTASLRPNPHPSIFPPSTPNPTPSSADHDRRYVKSEGTLLLASVWGQNTSENAQEAFSLLWSEDEKIWVAVYRLSLTVCEFDRYSHCSKS